MKLTLFLIGATIGWFSFSASAASRDYGPDCSAEQAENFKQQYKDAALDTLAAVAQISWQEVPTCFSVGQLTQAIRGLSRVALRANAIHEGVDSTLALAVEQMTKESVAMGGFCGENGISILNGFDVRDVKKIERGDLPAIKSQLSKIQAETSALLNLLGIANASVPIRLPRGSGGGGGGGL